VEAVPTDRPAGPAAVAPLAHRWRVPPILIAELQSERARARRDVLPPLPGAACGGAARADDVPTAAARGVALLTAIVRRRAEPPNAAQHAQFDLAEASAPPTPVRALRASSSTGQRGQTAYLRTSDRHARDRRSRARAKRTPHDRLGIRSSRRRQGDRATGASARNERAIVRMLWRTGGAIMVPPPWRGNHDLRARPMPVAGDRRGRPGSAAEEETVSGRASQPMRARRPRPVRVRVGSWR
jgi:hypothetical protein